MTTTKNIGNWWKPWKNVPKKLVSSYLFILVIYFPHKICSIPKKTECHSRNIVQVYLLANSDDFIITSSNIKYLINFQGKTIPQVAIKWLLQKDVVPSVIIGATSVKQLEDNIGAASNWRLSKEQVLVLPNEL